MHSRLVGSLVAAWILQPTSLSAASNAPVSLHATAAHPPRVGAAARRHPRPASHHRPAKHPPAPHHTSSSLPSNALASPHHDAHEAAPALSLPPPPGPPPAIASEAPPEAAPLLIPVQGVFARQLRDTFNAARSDARVHDAIDIPAPRHTPVFAATHGTVIKLFLSARGGITVNQLGDDGRTVYYYAHLEGYAPGLVEGQVLHRGDVVGYVGDTGNAGPGNYHLHFAIWRAPDLKRYWEGENINPYPLLHDDAAPAPPAGLLMSETSAVRAPRSAP